MRLFILGATGAIGKQLVELALHQGHEVTAYVRSPSAISVKPGAALQVLAGDAFNPEAMAKAMDGHELVLSAFGPTTIRASTLRRDFGRSVAEAMRQSAVRRIQLVSAAFLFRDISLFASLLKATLFRQMIPDMAGMEASLTQSDLEWTIVRPPRLSNGPATHHYRVADGDLPRKGYLISRADVAHFMIEEAERPKHIREIVGLAY